jgi:hypothetical protein
MLDTDQLKNPVSVEVTQGLGGNISYGIVKIEADRHFVLLVHTR